MSIQSLTLFAPLIFLIICHFNPSYDLSCQYSNICMKLKMLEMDYSQEDVLLNQMLHYFCWWLCWTGSPFFWNKQLIIIIIIISSSTRKTEGRNNPHLASSRGNDHICLNEVWWLSFGCLDGVWKLSELCLEGAWKVS